MNSTSIFINESSLTVFWVRVCVCILFFQVLVSGLYFYRMSWVCVTWRCVTSDSWWLSEWVMFIMSWSQQPFWAHLQSHASHFFYGSIHLIFGLLLSCCPHFPQHDCVLQRTLPSHHLPPIGLHTISKAADTVNVTKITMRLLSERKQVKLLLENWRDSWDKLIMQHAWLIFISCYWEWN